MVSVRFVQKAFGGCCDCQSSNVLFEEELKVELVVLSMVDGCRGIWPSLAAALQGSWAFYCNRIVDTKASRIVVMLCCPDYRTPPQLATCDLF